MVEWNLWHKCHKINEGYQNCYVYRTGSKHGRDSSVVARTKSFDLLVKRNRQKEYKISAGEMINTYFTSAFLLPDADEWRIKRAD